MAKNIVVCCDGSGNEYGDHNTNVLKLFSVLPKNEGRQITFYDPGVGTFSLPSALTRMARSASGILGLAFGFAVRIAQLSWACFGLLSYLRLAIRKPDRPPAPAATTVASQTEVRPA